MNIFTVRPGRAKLVAWIFIGLAAGFAGRGTLADDLPKHDPNAKVSAPTRIDWVFALSNQSPAEPPADWLKGYAAQRPGMAKAAARLWERVVADGQDEAAVAEGKKRLEELQKVIEGDKK